jgi:hypothetical protein
LLAGGAGFGDVPLGGGLEIGVDFESVVRGFAPSGVTVKLCREVSGIAYAARACN